MATVAMATVIIAVAAEIVVPGRARMPMPRAAWPTVREIERVPLAARLEAPLEAPLEAE
jgi:hypothetical protein